MWRDLGAIYGEPLFCLFPVASVLTSAVAFMLFAAPMTWLAARAPAALERYRIQRRRPHAQDLVGPSLKWWAVNNLTLLAAVVVAWPLLRLSGVHAGPLPPWYAIVFELVFFIYLDDFLFYWAHRALHGRLLYKRIHGWHHTILTPWAVTGHYMHPLEYLVTGSVALIGPLLVGAHVVTLWLWLAVRQWEAAEGHCGYDFPWSPTHLLPLSDGAVHHDVHHARVRGNYAGFFPWTDAAFGTLSRGYLEDVGTRHPWVRRLATWSQR